MHSHSCGVRTKARFGHPGHPIPHSDCAQGEDTIKPTRKATSGMLRSGEKVSEVSGGLTESKFRTPRTAFQPLPFVQGENRFGTLSREESENTVRGVRDCRHSDFPDGSDTLSGTLHRAG